jgi:hypothetical protein
MTNIAPFDEKQNPGNRMSKGERTDLCALVRRREKFEKTAAAQRTAELLADFERQLASIYSYDTDETWRAAHAEAKKVIAEAEVTIAARCRELGIPEEFQPGLSFGWHGRGENASKDRRAELRKVAETRLDVMEKSAKTQIERKSIEMQEHIVRDRITSEAAQVLLARLPAIESLMPPLDARLFLESVPLLRSYRDA